MSSFMLSETTLKEFHNTYQQLSPLPEKKSAPFGIKSYYHCVDDMIKYTKKNVILLFKLLM
jgi:hypothetical protein